MSFTTTVGQKCLHPTAFIISKQNVETLALIFNSVANELFGKKMYVLGPKYNLTNSVEGKNEEPGLKSKKMFGRR